MTPKLKKQNAKMLLKEDTPKEPNWDKELIVLSLKHIQHEKECFSDWNKKEISKFWDFNRRLHSMTWIDVFKTASNGAQKRGMAYTVIPRKNYRGIEFVKISRMTSLCLNYGLTMRCAYMDSVKSSCFIYAS